MADGSIRYNIGFNADTAGLQKIKKEFQEIAKIKIKNPMVDNQAIVEAQRVSAELKKAYESAFTGDKLNVSLFNKNLGSLNMPLTQIYESMSKLGPMGTQAFNDIATSALLAGTKIERQTGTLDKLGRMIGNSMKYAFSTAVVNEFSQKIGEATNYVVKLDSSLNAIRQVTGRSVEDMRSFAVEANKVAQSLGKSTRDYTESALELYRQGLSDAEVKARNETILKASAVTQQSASAVSEQLTAVWNGYKVGADQTEASIDKLQAVANTTASDLSELSTGMQKVASVANTMGVSMDQMNAILATVLSTTRESPETVGTAYRTILARMSSIQAGEDTEDGANLTSYTKKMNDLGVSVLDSTGKLRDMGSVIEEVGGKWNGYSREQQLALAQIMAGKIKSLCSR